MSAKPIDIVIMWVNGTDPEWLKEKSKYSEDNASIDDSINRYRDWDNLQYIFRGIEQFMPWVRKIHFVTWGHIPAWMNTSHKKLNIVRHDDFIPVKYLPTFSANPIEINLHRIKGLAERFILFNDDMFVTQPVRPSRFFASNGSPKEQIMLATLSSRKVDDVFPHILLNNNAVMNMELNAKSIIVKNWQKLYSPRNGLYAALKNIALTPFSLNLVPMLNTPHMPSPLLKSVMQEVWGKYPKELNQTSKTRFRSMADINQYVFKQWQVWTGRSEPSNYKKYCSYVSRFPGDLPKLERALGDRRCQLLCINDSELSGNFDDIKRQVNGLLDARMPNKSGFER